MGQVLLLLDSMPATILAADDPQPPAAQPARRAASPVSRDRAARLAAGLRVPRLHIPPQPPARSPTSPDSSSTTVDPGEILSDLSPLPPLPVDPNIGHRLPHHHHHHHHRPSSAHSSIYSAPAAPITPPRSPTAALLNFVKRTALSATFPADMPHLRRSLRSAVRARAASASSSTPVPPTTPTAGEHRASLFSHLHISLQTGSTNSAPSSPTTPPSPAPKLDASGPPGPSNASVYSSLSASTNLTAIIAPFLQRGPDDAHSPPVPDLGSNTNTAARMFSQHHMYAESPTDGAAGEHLWQEIRMRVLPLFRGEGLSSTIEELNSMLARYLDKQLYPTIFEELKEVLREGMAELTNKFFSDVSYDPATHGPASSSLYLLRWTEVWAFYFGVVLPYLMSVFMPLQVEIKGSRVVTSVRSLVLLMFRNCAVLPRFDELFVMSQNLTCELVALHAQVHDPSGSLPSPTTSTESLATTYHATETKAAQMLQMVMHLNDLTIRQADTVPSSAMSEDAARLKRFKELSRLYKGTFMKLRTRVG
ncbi:hypothetical protein AMAG_03698 [Allomyces macrogynus ATCC 38327]|uniref:Uncharacterized protein n=1 Tax=Allomyces macrogynus (strain ATCC 38327) TaxID=578462 RepID=A0A0L0S9Z6_ALLM3|nr:hypothetical protein AMAG_03698 [Allomyces macrogynus ATCC 38327]|eukprot:KNE59418.1 hypothetical protein AMAG_03698 [Allomyces macrogynus ATCC 38327]